MSNSRQVRVLDAGEACPALPLVDGEGVALAMIWPGVGAAIDRIGVPPDAVASERATDG